MIFRGGKGLSRGQPGGEAPKMGFFYQKPRFPRPKRRHQRLGARHQRPGARHQGNKQRHRPKVRRPFWRGGATRGEGCVIWGANRVSRAKCGVTSRRGVVPWANPDAPLVKTGVTRGRRSVASNGARAGGRQQRNFRSRPGDGCVGAKRSSPGALKLIEFVCSIRSSPGAQALLVLRCSRNSATHG